jgi:hypothetical protein
MFRRLALTVIVVALTSHALLAQQRPSVGPRAILHSIIRSAQLTDEQKAHCGAREEDRSAVLTKGYCRCECAVAELFA